MTLEEYYAVKMLIRIALRSREYENNAVMYDTTTGLKMSIEEIIKIATQYIYQN